jgi:hypothetical protein
MNISIIGPWLLCVVISILIVQFPSKTLQDDELTNTYINFFYQFGNIKHEALLMHANEDPNEAMLRIVRHNYREIRPFFEALEPVLAVTSKYSAEAEYFATRCNELLNRVKVPVYLKFKCKILVNLKFERAINSMIFRDPDKNIKCFNSDQDC